MRVRGLRAWVPLVVAGVIAASCTSEPDAALPTVELSTTSVTTLPPTTETPTTTEAPTTTTLDPRIAEVEAAVALARDTQLKVLTDPSTPVEELSAALAGRALESVVASVLKIRADGLSIEGSFVGRAVETVFTDFGAVHVQCGLDAVGSYDAAGAVVTPPDETPLLLRYEVVFVESEDVWKVELVRFDSGDPVPCDL